LPFYFPFSLGLEPNRLRPFKKNPEGAVVRGVAPHAFDVNIDNLWRTSSYCYNAVTNLPNVDYKNAGFTFFFSG
jgi:hypothetical protein